MTRFDPAFLGEIKDRLDVVDVCGRRVKLRKAGTEWCGLSPFNAERSPSFYANSRKQSWFDFSANLSGDIFKFVMLTEGLSFPDAVERCAADAGLPMPIGWKHGATHNPQAEIEKAARDEAFRLKTEQRDAAEARRKKSIRELAHDIWKEGKPIAGTTADIYLRSRGIDFGAEFSTLRFHASLTHEDVEKGEITRWPGLIAAVQSPDEGRFLAIWRIFLDAEGRKAPLPNPKLGLGSYTAEGGSVWLGKPGEVANVAEGIESSCGVFGLLRRKQSVQASLSTSGMVNFVPPRGCQSTLIWPDGDVAKIKADLRTGIERTLASAGMRAADVLQNRLRGENHPSSIQPIPLRAIDFLDVWAKTKGLWEDGDGRTTPGREPGE